MKIHRFDQGSGEWYRARLGVPTASQFHKIITPLGKPSAQAKGYMYRLIAERLLRDTMDDQIKTEWIERGREQEPNAVAQFQFANSVELEPAGFITTNNGELGCSPDRLVKGKREAVEVKCPAPWTQIQYLLEGPGNDYRQQVQGQLLVGEFECVHFYSWHPRMPPLHRVTLREVAFIKTLKAALSAFLEVLEAETERARALGAYVETVWPQLPLEHAYGDQAGPEPLQIIVPE